MEEKDKTVTEKRVQFGTYEIRHYGITLGDNPSVSIGPPVSLDWDYANVTTGELLDDGQSNIYNSNSNNNNVPNDNITNIQNRDKVKRTGNRLKLNYYQRHDILQNAGFTEGEIKKAERVVFFDQSHRNFSMYVSYPNIFIARVRASFGRRKNKRFLNRYHKKWKKEKQKGKEKGCKK